MIAHKKNVGKYELMRRIGVGGMAEVYEATLTGAGGFSRRLAVKVLLPDFQDDPAIVDMFIDEANITAKLEHPNIVNVIDFGRTEDVYYLAMEYVDGWTLRRVQRRLQRAGELMPVAAAARIISELCLALDYIHTSGHGIVHRDVSPQNIFLTRQGQIKLGDFGVAKAQARRTRTVEGTIKGKLAYVAPEQVTGDPVSPRTDIYAAGLVLYELLTGGPLIKGEREIDMIQAAMNPVVVAPSSLRPEASPLDDAITRALEQQATLRHPTAAAFSAALEPWGGERGNSALKALVGRLQGKGTPQGQRASTPGVTAQPGGGGTVALPQGSGLEVSAPPGGTQALPPGSGLDDPLAAGLPTDDEQPTTASTPSAKRPAARPPKRWVAPVLVVVLLAGAAAAGLVLWSRGDRSATVLDAGGRQLVMGPAVDAALTHSADLAPSTDLATTPEQVAADAPSKGDASVRRRPRRRRRSRRGHRRARRRRVRPPRPAPKAKTPAAEEFSAQQQRAAASQRIKQVLGSARSRGLYPGDEAAFDAMVRKARRSLDQAAVSALERFVSGFKMDRRRADRKLKRLGRAVKRAGLSKAQQEEMERRSQRILKLIIGGRLVEASRQMTRALGRVRSAR